MDRNSVKHFPFNCFHTVAAGFLVISQGIGLECRKEIVIAMNPQELPGKLHVYTNFYLMFLFLHFLTILTFKTIKIYEAKSPPD